VDATTILTLVFFGVFAVFLIGYLVLGGGREREAPPPGPGGKDHGQRQKPWTLPDEIRRGGKQLP
jgi:hypothetical protein